MIEELLQGNSQFNETVFKKISPGIVAWSQDRVRKSSGSVVLIQESRPDILRKPPGMLAIRECGRNVFRITGRFSRMCFFFYIRGILKNESCTLIPSTGIKE
jgi:hypothetical protein